MSGHEIVWITGASSGIGAATALAFVRRGAVVAVSARSAAALADLAAQAPDQLIPFPLDVTDAMAVAATVAAIERCHGPLDRVILNAGSHQPISADTFDSAVVRRLMEVNVMGVVHGLAAVLPRFLERGRGQIAVVASVAGYGGLPTAAAYGATKAALINMLAALRFDVAGRGPDLRLICPGFVRTPLTARNPFAMPFVMAPDRAAQRIIRGLTIGRAFEITFPRRFTWALKAVNLLPWKPYFWLVAKATGA